MSFDIPERFAMMTCVLEDLHSHAVEGQAADLTPDMQMPLLHALKQGARAIISDCDRIAAQLEGYTGG